jgi:hypothetical protein
MGRRIVGLGVELRQRFWSITKHRAEAERVESSAASASRPSSVGV